MIDRVAKGLRSWRETSFEPFRQPIFRAIWAAALASNIGAVVQTVGASWSMIAMSASPQLVALVQTAAMLPIVLLALPAGALADNVERRPLMLASQVLGASSAAVLAVLSFLQALTPLLLLSFTALIGAAVALYQPAWQASLGDFVPRASLPAAVSLNVLGFNMARSIGPVLGGILIASAGVTIVFAFNAVSFLALIIVLAAVRFPQTERVHLPERMIPAIAAGLRFVVLSPVLQRVYLRASLFGFGASAAWSLLPVVAHLHLGGGPMSFGLLMGSLGGGSLGGALVATWVRAFAGNNRMLSLSTSGFGLAALGLAFSNSLILSAICAFAAGVAWIFVFTTTRTCVQLSSPRWVVGRTVSLGQVASFGCMALGSACWGAAANTFGVTEALAASGVFLLLSAVAALPAKLPPMSLGEAVLPSALRAPPPRIELDGRVGPVFITIEYDVPIERAAEFLALMNEIRRIRRRNGATGWTVQQDIDKPDSWIERIRSPSWSDHLRRLDRYTADERRVIARAETFRAAERRPVRRMVERPHGSSPLR